MVVSDINEGENSFRSLAENLPGIVYRVLLEDDNRVIFFNNMVQTMTGYRPEDLKKGNVYSLDPLILPEDRIHAINIIKDAIEKNAPFEVEYRINNKSGELKWFFERGRPIRGDNGNPSYIDGVIFDISERKENEQKLKESEAKYRLITENANDLIVIVDENFEYEFLNEQVHKKLRGTSKNDRIGKSVLSIIHPEDQETALKALKKGFITGKGTIEVRLINNDRTYDWFEVRGKTFKDDDGKTKAILITRDISKRKLTEEALIKSETKFRNIFESIPMGLHLYKLNSQGNLIFKGCNPAANKILNTNCEQFINKTIEEAFPLLVKTDIPKRYKLLAKEGGEWKWDQVDYEENRIKGAFEVVAFQTAPNTMVTSFMDITEQQQIQTELQESESLLKNAQELAHIGHWKLDPSTMEVSGSDELFKIFGLTHDEATLEQFAEVVHPDDREMDLFRIRRGMEKGESWDIEHRVISKDGTEKWVHALGEAIKDDDGKIIMLMGTVQDITERKEMEERYLKQNVFLNNILESLTHPLYVINVKDYTIALANSTATADGLKHGQYCYNLSHGSNTPCEAPYICPLNIVKNTKKTCVVEHVHYDQEGNEKIYEIYGYPILNEDGNVVQMIEYALNVTDRKIAKQALKKSEIKYRHLFENSPYYIILLDKEGNFIDCNNSTVDIYGYPKEEFFGKNFREMPIIPPDIYPLLENIMELLFKGEVPSPIEFKPITKDGNIIWINSQASLIKLDNEFFIYIIGQDITERKKAERKLKESEQALKVSEEKYRTFVENFQGIAYQAYEDYFADFFHGAVEEITGYTPDDFITGRIKWNQLFHPDDASKFLSQQKQFDETPYTQLEYRIKAKDGSTHWILSNAQKFYDETKKKVGVRGIFIDITDKKKSEEQLKESEEKYRTLSDYSMVGISIIQDMQFKYVNQKLADNLGYTVEELLNMKPGELFPKLVHPEDLEDAINISKKNQAGEVDSINVIALHGIKKNGDSIWLELFSRSIQFEGRPAAMNSSIDITERKKAEQELKESEEKFRLLFEAIADPIHVIDADLKIIYMNPAFEEWLKSYNLYFDVIGKNPVEAWPHIGEEVNDEYKKVFETKKIHLKRDWEQVNDITMFTETRKIPIIKSGKVIQIITIVRDFSDRKKAEQKLKESEEKFRNFTEQSLMGVAIIQDNVVKYASKRLADIYGYSVEEILNFEPNGFLNLIDSEYLEIVKDQANKKQLGQEDTIAHYEVRCVKKTGEKFWVENYSKTINYKGKPADFVTNIEITERKKAEQLLKESEEKFRKIAEQSFMGIYIIQDGLIVYRNQRAVEVGGYSDEEIQSWKPYEYAKAIHPDDRELVLERSGKKEKGETDVSSHYQYRIIKNSGEIVMIDNFSKTINYMGRPANLVMTLDITEKILAEQELKESEKKYRHLFESSPYFIGLIDEDGTLVDSNSSISKFLSMQTKEDVIGKNILDILSIVEENKEIIPLLKNLFQEAHSNEPGKSHEFKLHRSTGGFMWLEAEGSTIEINNQKLLQFIVQDITNRKTIEEELKESEIKFRTITEQFLMGIGILQDEELKYANLKFANMFGYTVEEFTDMTYSEFLTYIHPEDRAKLLRQVEKRKDRTRDTGVTYQFRAFKKTGELFWANIYSRIINYQGKRAGLLAILDTTEMKMGELKLKESEEKFRKIAEQSFMGIIIRQHDSIKYANDAAINIFGYSMEDIQEWSFEYITKKHIYPEDLSYIRENRRTERDGNSEIKQFLSYRIITKSGKLRWVDQYSKIFLYQGEISELITIVDITEKKAAERIILEENKKLLELDKIRRDFLIRASHELKTPLNSIYSTSEFLLHYNEAILDEKLKQFLEIIYKGGKRLKMLIENLLDVSRIESDKIKLNIVKKNIRKIMDKCIKEVYFLSEKRNITIIFEKSEDILINLDKVRMEQVFVNILVNAIKNTPNFGEVAIKTLQEKDCVKIIVNDTGVGFTEEEKLKTFEKFGKIERYGQGMDIDTEGSGLGLFISKEIVELHGGDIELLSQGRNKGSTFIIRLPL